MKTERIAEILALHAIPYAIQDGRIYADTMACGTAAFKEVEDLTDFTRSQLYAWLGY